MPIASAHPLMTANRHSRRLGLSNLESALPSMVVPGAQITAAAIIGPASAPAPASSTPAIVVTPLLVIGRLLRCAPSSFTPGNIVLVVAATEVCTPGWATDHG